MAVRPIVNGWTKRFSLGTLQPLYGEPGHFFPEIGPAQRTCAPFAVGASS